jgi:hypothetical protein
MVTAEMIERTYSTVEVARLVGVDSQRIEYALRQFRIREPGRNRSGKRAWTMSEVQTVREYFALLAKVKQHAV